MTKRKKVLFALLLIIVVGLDFYHPLGSEHAVHFWWQKIPGFDAMFGFFGCFLLMLFAKKVIYPLFSREEDYYDR